MKSVSLGNKKGIEALARQAHSKGAVLKNIGVFLKFAVT